ncbi:hypothetical protein BD560DRAFT_304177, partial [Blakeslea trispora]
MFKRAHKELGKQKIEEELFDAEDNKEKLAGVFSEESDIDSDTDDSDDEQTRRYKKKARKQLIATFNQLADQAGSDDDSEEEEEEENEEDEEEANQNDSEEELEETITFTCEICPDKKLKKESQVEEHLQS